MTSYPKNDLFIPIRGTNTITITNQNTNQITNQNNMITQSLQKQPTITHYISGSISKFDNVTEEIMDKQLSTEERIDVFKTLALNFFDDNTFCLSYYTKINKIPPCEQVYAQYGFINCKTPEEKLHLLNVYKTCLEKCYPDLFVFKPLQILHQHFCNDTIADFIFFS